MNHDSKNHDEYCFGLVTFFLQFMLINYERDIVTKLESSPPKIFFSLAVTN